MQYNLKNTKKKNTKKETIQFYIPLNLTKKIFKKKITKTLKCNININIKKINKLKH